MAPIFVILTQANEHSLRLVATHLPIKLVAGSGNAPLSVRLMRPAGSLDLPASNLAVLGGNDPHSSGVTSQRASMNTLRPIGGD